MKVSASLVVSSVEEYRLGFETIESGFLQDEVFKCLDKDGIEIVEVLLDRVKGAGKTSIAILSEMSEIIFRLFDTNENIIIYFFCDDLNEIPNTQKKVSPQAYRSRLFSSMFERFVRKQKVDDIENIAISIEAFGRTEYLHFIVRSHHMKYIDYIQRNIEETYTK